MDIICLIKPQFECGKEIADKYKGIIIVKEIHKNILKDIINMFNHYNFYLNNISYSPIKGGDGNIEYIAYISNKKNSNSIIDINNLVNIAFKSYK